MWWKMWGVPCSVMLRISLRHEILNALARWWPTSVRHGWQ